MTSEDKFKKLQEIWKNLSGEGGCTVSSKHKNEDTISNGVTSSAPFSLNSIEFKDKRVDDDKLDGRASEKESHINRIQGAINSMGDYVCATKRCLNLETKPVIDIMSVRILCNNNTSIRNEEPRKICGVIFVFDVYGNICFIYERDLVDVYNSDELDVIPVDSNIATLSLSFIAPDDLMSICLPDICVNIQDFDTGEIIVKGCAHLPMSVDTTEEQNHPFEQFRTLTIPGIGNGCSAVIDYIALTYGVFAHVEVKLCASGSEDKEDEQGEYFLVYGKISVEYNLHHPEKRKNSITLFEVEKDSWGLEQAELNCPITLSRSLVAVPAYSSLTVHVDLWSEANNIVQGSFTFDTDNHALDGFIPGFNHTNAKLTVDWKQPLMDNARTLSRWPRNLIMSNSSNYFGLHLIEVFSLFIGHQIDKDLRLYGAINFWGGTILNIFERDKNDPYLLPRGCNMLPIQIFNKSLLPGNLSHLSVDLEDVEGLLSIKGLIVINIISGKEEWYNRLLCSVVKGVDYRSFAALHYTIFSNALKAELKVQFYSESEHFTNTCIRIYGSLVLRYGEYGIKTQYEKDHHQCLLFKRYNENPLEKFGNDFDLELLRSVVAVPCSSSVIVVADLSCCLSTGFTACLRKTERFQIGTENITIDGDQFSLRIAVKWS